MLADAFRSEAYRLSRNRMALFWSLLTVPLLYGGGGIIYHMLTKARAADIAEAVNTPIDMGNTAIDLGSTLVENMAMGANAGTLTFTLIAAAILYAGDYRWETWRLISARNRRASLILGKIATFKLLALVAMLLLLVTGLFVAVAQSMVFERPLTFTFGGDKAADLGLYALLSLWRIVQYGLVALITAVVTRSLMAALFVPIVIGFGQSLLGQFMPLLGWETSMWAPQLLLPGLAYDTLKAYVAGQPGLADGLWIKSLLSMTVWSVGATGLALFAFQRQDLSKE